MTEKSASIHLFGSIEAVQPKGLLWQARQYSVSKLAIALSDFTVAVWVFLSIRAFHGWITALMAIATLLYACLMCWKGQTSRRRIKNGADPQENI
jgi:hypothetical protein